MATRKHLVDQQVESCIGELTGCVESLLARYPSVTVLAALLAGVEIGAQESVRDGSLNRAQLAARLEQVRRRALLKPRASQPKSGDQLPECLD